MNNEIYIFDGDEYDDLPLVTEAVNKTVTKGVLVKIGVFRDVPIELSDYMGGVIDEMFETINDNIYDATAGELAGVVHCDTAARMHLEQRIADLLHDTLDVDDVLLREESRTISYISEGAE